jgi:hypothetical protein
MRAFISYSHADQTHLTNLEKHLAQVKRDGLLNLWTDHAIEAGGNLDAEITEALNSSELFIALISPDYINSGYCYEKEFQFAQRLHQQKNLKIVPVIVEPCDWHNTPFSDLKAIPKDGKPISTWNNLNTAFLDVITNLRSLLIKEENGFLKPKGNTSTASKYRAQRDFDSIEKMEFVTNGFNEIVTKLREYIHEVIEVEGIKAKIIEDSNQHFSCLLVNRNKQNMESTLTLSKSDVANKSNRNMGFQRSEHWIQADIQEKNHQGKSWTFNVGYDEYKLFWTNSEDHSYNNEQQQLIVQNMLDSIYNGWLHSIGINF